LLLSDFLFSKDLSFVKLSTDRYETFHTY